MAKPCSVCVSHKLARVDQSILKGETLACISRKFGFSPDALGRHRKHMRTAMKTAVALQADYGSSLLDQIQKIKADVESLASEAAHRRDTGGALKALREQLRVIELEARLSGELETSNKVNVAVQVNNEARFDKLVPLEAQIRVAHDFLMRKAPHLLAVSTEVQS